MRDNQPSSRRQFLRGAGAALAVGAGVGLASQSAAAAPVTDKHYEIVVEPIDDTTTFQLEFGPDAEPVVALGPRDGYTSATGSYVSGGIYDGSDSVHVGVDTYSLETVWVTGGPAVIGAQFMPENFSPSIGAPSDGDAPRFCEVDVSGDGKYVVGMPFVSGVGTCRGTRYGAVWEADDTAEFAPTQFTGIDQTGREDGEASTFYLPLVSPTGDGPPGLNFTAQDHVVTMEHNGRDEPVGTRFGPGDTELTDRREPHDGVGTLGIVDGGRDVYQTAAFQKDPATLWSSYDLYDPIPTRPCWMRLDDGVTVDVSLTDDDRGCRWV